MMERVKLFLVRHFEQILVFIILAAAILGTFFMQDKTLLLNFYFLPVVFASYYLGKRLGVLSAFLSVLAVVVCAIIFHVNFFPQDQEFRGIFLLSSWGGFLLLTSYAVGSLYEQKERRTEELERAYVGILEILSKYIETKDGYTKGHSMRVSEYAKSIAIAMELPRHQVENVRVAGLLHDIGKIEISSEVIQKAAALTPQEKDLIDTHSERGGVILAKVGEVLQEVVPIVVAHHRYFEKALDSSEDALKELPLGARIVAVADAFDAITTDRPYRKGKAPWEAMQEIVGQTGHQFDPDVVDAFRRVVSTKMEQI
ncbi:MAG TPA: HD domain-containing phosphohydrolase [Terriglobales bacterium]|nr:HD domain-containing phosphohydrolase [Terriglobales bacterium]